jgi:hypothetical protein
MSTIDRLVNEGMPSETWGTRSRRFLPSEAIGWARARERAPVSRQSGPDST